MLKGFKQFILKGNVVDLAVGIVVGVSFGNVVSALVRDIITPLIAALGGAPNFSSISFTINHSRFMIGDFFNVLISFLINAAVMYFFVILPMNKLMSVTKRGKTATRKKCPECLSIIPIEAKRCAFCTSILATEI